MGGGVRKKRTSLDVDGDIFFFYAKERRRVETDDNTCMIKWKLKPCLNDSFTQKERSHADNFYYSAIDVGMYSPFFFFKLDEISCRPSGIIMDSREERRRHTLRVQGVALSVAELIWSCVTVATENLFVKFTTPVFAKSLSLLQKKEPNWTPRVMFVHLLLLLCALFEGWYTHYWAFVEVM